MINVRKVIAFKLLALLIGTVGIAHGQKAGRQFIINGSINVDTGIVELMMLSDSSYYPHNVYSKAEVRNGKFTLTGNIPYPQGVTVRYNKSFGSSLFVIESGQQTLKLDLNNFRRVPEIDNAIMKEYYGDFKTAFKLHKEKTNLFYHHWDSLTNVHDRKLPESMERALRETQKKHYQQSDSILLGYIASHPNSYIGLWKLVEIASFSGYEEVFDSAFAKLSTSLKLTYTGEQLSKKLASGRALSVGKAFPQMDCISQTRSPLRISDQNKFTLVDFWYSNCGPCIAQFPMLDSIYRGFKNKGFEIIGISTDKKKYELNWKDAISKHNLSWLQYWDIDGKNASNYSINAFPTNFLLNTQGEIIKKNISPVELKAFLMDNLN